MTERLVTHFTPEKGDFFDKIYSSFVFPNVGKVDIQYEDFVICEEVLQFLGKVYMKSEQMEYIKFKKEKGAEECLSWCRGWDGSSLRCYCGQNKIKFMFGSSEGGAFKYIYAGVV